MKYAMVGLTVAVVLAGLVGLLGWVAYAGEVADASSETRLRALLSTPAIDPFDRNVSDFRKSAERTRFSTEVHDVAVVGMGRVIVKRTLDAPPPMVILEAPIAIIVDPLRGTGVGHLDMDSALGDSIPLMVEGDTVEVWNAFAELIRVGSFTRR